MDGIPDSLRRTRQNRKQNLDTTSALKYHYEALLEFLIPHIAEWKSLSNFPDEEDDGYAPESVDESQQQNFTMEIQQHQIVAALMNLWGPHNPRHYLRPQLHLVEFQLGKNIQMQHVKGRSRILK